MGNSVDESKFNKWRAIVALVHADQVVHSEERNFIHGFLERIQFSEDQRKTLLKELDQPANIDQIIPKITSKADIGQLVHFARVLCCRDGEFHPSEQKILEKLNTNALAKSDMSSALELANREAEAANIRQEKRPKFLLERFLEYVAKDRE